MVVTNAPHRSAFNPVERRMAPLSKATANVVISHDFHGNHLDKNHQTIDKDLERENMKYAGNELRKIFHGLPLYCENLAIKIKSQR